MCDATECAANERVVGNTCVACPAGTTNVAGDDASQGDTMCDATECAANERVVGNTCVACPAGTTNVAGDNPAGADTNCDAGQEQVNLTFAAGAKVGDQVTVHVRYALNPDTLDHHTFGPSEALLVIPVPVGLTVAEDVNSALAAGQAAADAGKNAAGAVIGQDADGRPVLRIVVSGTDPRRIAPGDLARITFTQAQPGPYAFSFGDQTTVTPPSVNARLNAQDANLDFVDEPGGDEALILSFTQIPRFGDALPNDLSVRVNYRTQPEDLALDALSQPRSFVFQIHFSPNLYLDTEFLSDIVRKLHPCVGACFQSTLVEDDANGWKVLRVFYSLEETFQPGPIFTINGFTPMPGSVGPYQVRFQIGDDETSYVPGDQTSVPYQLRGEPIVLE
jgi:hypothetical protein